MEVVVGPSGRRTSGQLVRFSDVGEMNGRGSAWLEDGRGNFQRVEWRGSREW